MHVYISIKSKNMTAVEMSSAYHGGVTFYTAQGNDLPVYR
jgi:hypothetical protein